MALTMVEPGRFLLDGAVVFDNAPVIEREGRRVLSQCSECGNSRWLVSLKGLKLADSSALSVCLSWIRYSKQQDVRLCFTEIPQELHALARVCGIEKILENASCPS